MWLHIHCTMAHNYSAVLYLFCAFYWMVMMIKIVMTIIKMKMMTHGAYLNG